MHWPMVPSFSSLQINARFCQLPVLQYSLKEIFAGVIIGFEYRAVEFLLGVQFPVTGSKHKKVYNDQ
jgi:hypothetical protein